MKHKTWCLLLLFSLSVIGCGRDDAGAPENKADKFKVIPYNLSQEDVKASWSSVLLSEKLPETEDEIEKERSFQINQSIEGIRGELNAYGGSWSAWRDKVSPAIADIKNLYENDPYNPEKLSFYKFIKAKDDYFYNKESLELIVKQGMIEHKESPVKTMIKLSKDLKKLGIDLIYVPVPMSIEIYPEYATDKAKGDIIIAPELRQMYLDMLQGGVEVLDLLADFQREKNNTENASLFIPCDNHWSNYAVRLAAKKLGQRLSRYPYIRETQLSAKCYSTKYYEDFNTGKAYSRLTDELRKDIKPFLLTAEQVISPDGNLYEEVDDASVCVIGDSFAYYFNERIHGGIMAHLAKEIRQPVSFYASSGLFPSQLGNEAKRLFSGNRKMVIYVQDARQLLPRDDWEALDLNKAMNRSED